MKSVFDTILWLESESTGRQFPTVLFSGDTDMATAGWVSLTSTEKHDVVVTKLTAEEYHAIAKNAAGYVQVEQRMNTVLGRTDLRCPWFVRAEQAGPSGKGLSFQDFKKAYVPPVICYRDIYQAGAVAREISRVSRGEFERNGGNLVVAQ